MADKSKKDEPQNEEKDDLQKKVEEAHQEAEEKQEAEEQKLDGEDQVEPTSADQSSAEATDDSASEVSELKAQLARCMADMQNFKRRSEEDKSKWIKFANYELLKELLPIIDNFDRGCQQLPEELKDNGWVKGVVNTHDDLMKALEKVGVKRIETVGKPLDPNIHEAVMQGEGEKDVIIEEFEPGYTYHEQTLKAAKVKVGSGAS